MKLFVALLFCSTLIGKDPDILYLTWVKDPTSTIRLLWHTSDEETASKVTYRLPQEVSSQEVIGESWQVKETSTRVHLVDLETLEADQTYLFKIEGSEKEYRFRTMPKTLHRNVRFAVGGDAYYYWGTEVFQRMSRMIGRHDPDFYVIGGDLAYTTGKKHFLQGRRWELARWQTFLRTLQRTVKGQERRLIPFLPVVGNHDVTRNHQMFYELFTFPEKNKAYRFLDFGNYFRLIMLDTGHTSPIEGEQTRWLETALNYPGSYLFPIYHIGAYPSYYPFNNKTSSLLRELWSPLFEKYNVPVAFEHHNHCFKRTHPIKAGQIDPSGVVYLGDGSWGVPPRQYKTNLWYIAKTASINSCYIVTLTSDACTIEAKTPQAKTIDQIVLPNKS